MDRTRQLIIRQFTLGTDLDSDLQVRGAAGSVDDGTQGEVTGLIAPFNRVTKISAGYWEQIHPTAFDRTIEHRGQRVPLYMTHDTTTQPPIGQSSDWQSTTLGMRTVFRMANTTAARDARHLVADGMVECLSIGFFPRQDRTDEVNIDDESGVLVTRVEVELDHVAMVVKPAYPDASIEQVRADTPAWRRELDEQLQSLNVS